MISEYFWLVVLIVLLSLCRETCAQVIAWPSEAWLDKAAHHNTQAIRFCMNLTDNKPEYDRCLDAVWQPPRVFGCSPRGFLFSRAYKASLRKAQRDSRCNTN